MRVQLRRGRAYHLNSEDETPIFSEGGYVRREFLKSTGEHWQTFFMVLGGEVLYRLRIPESSITSVEDDVVNYNGSLVSKIVWTDKEQHTPLVEGWLREVFRLYASSM
jgi:hypothetical protein